MPAILSTGRNQVLVLDFGERLFCVALFAAMLSRFWDAVIHGHSIAVYSILLVELSIILFTLIRRPATNISIDPVDWTIAVMATCAPMLVIPSSSAPIAPAPLWTFFLCFGVALQICGKLALNRRFGVLPANRGLAAKGPYAFVRHPIYCGYTITHIGFVLMAPNAWNLLVYVTGFILQVVRILREETLLVQDAEYREYQKRVRYRLFPGIF